MGDRRDRRGPPRPSDVDVDPLVVQRRVGEGVMRPGRRRATRWCRSRCRTAAATSSSEVKVRMWSNIARPRAGTGWMCRMSTPTRDQVHAAPKVLLHDHLDGGLRPQTIVDLAAEIGHELPAADAESAGALVHRVGRLGLPRALPRDLRPHRRRHAERSRRSPASRVSASRTWPPTAWSTPRCATPPSSTSAAG